MLRDPLGTWGRPTPRPGVVLFFSTFAGLSIIGLYRFGGRVGLHMPMFAKEGFLENLTFFLGFWAAVLCALAAIRTYRQHRDTQEFLVALAYWMCAGLLFLVAMEEISWGQQLVTFRTPQVWSALNYQQETTLHNLASREALTLAWKVVGVAFCTGAIGLMVAARISMSKLIGFIAPHPGLAPLALLAAYASVRLHPEIAEVLISIFFACYGYRVYVASPTAACQTARQGT